MVHRTLTCSVVLGKSSVGANTKVEFKCCMSFNQRKKETEIEVGSEAETQRHRSART